MAKRNEDVSFSLGGKTPARTPQERNEESREAVNPSEQFRMLILGDFSGRTNRGIVEAADIASRKVHVVDTDNLNAVLGKLKPEILLPVNEKSIVPLSFKTMDDFRPDALLQQIEAFGALLNLRNDLKDNRKCTEAAAKVQQLMGIAPKEKPSAPAKESATENASEFERLMNQTIAPKAAGAIDTQAFIANLVSGYMVPEADPEQGKMVTLLEDALSAALRAVLRHPVFQALEGAWRGIDFLTSRLNTDEELKLCILDISKDELYADIAGRQEIQKTRLFQMLVEQTRMPGAVRYSLVIGDFIFDSSQEDVELLSQIAALMKEAGASFIAAGSPKITGISSFAKFPDSGKWQPPADHALWEKLRAHASAAHIGLAAPRFLMRVPYGAKTDAIETYPFEEMPGAPVTEGYLWGNGAFAIAYAIGQGLLDNGSEPGTDVEDLPCHMAIVDGEKEMTPCAEAWLSDRAGDILHQLGLIPLLSVRNAAAVKIAGIHSIAKGGKPLATASTGA